MLYETKAFPGWGWHAGGRKVIALSLGHTQQLVLWYGLQGRNAGTLEGWGPLTLPSTPPFNVGRRIQNNQWSSWVREGDILLGDSVGTASTC
jgi:hypothetical protein